MVPADMLISDSDCYSPEACDPSAMLLGSLWVRTSVTGIMLLSTIKGKYLALLMKINDGLLYHRIGRLYK